MNAEHFTGIIATTVTPFKEDESIDELAFVKQIKYLLDADVDGISVGVLPVKGRPSRNWCSL